MTAPSKSQDSICSMCNQAEDEGQEDNIWWIECSVAKCSREYHLSCVGLTIDTLPKKHIPWYCLFCKQERKEFRRSVRHRTSLYREEQPNHTINRLKLMDTMDKLGDIDISINSLSPVQKKSTDVGKNVFSFLFLALIIFLLAYLFVSCQNFSTFVSF